MREFRRRNAGQMRNPALTVGQGQEQSDAEQEAEASIARDLEKKMSSTTESTMNWITNLVRPKIRSLLRRETPENLWIKCPDSGQMVFQKEVEDNLWVIPGSEHHLKMTAKVRLAHMFDGGQYETIRIPDVTQDPLKFRDEKRYTDRLKDARAKTGMQDSVLAGFGTLDQLPMVIAVQDFAFIGGTLGTAAGEAIVAAAEVALEKKAPLVLFAASGGARMQEGILSLMQMPRTTVAVQRLRRAGLPYIVVLTNPTTGGVTASYAMLGDVHIAEPGAMIGFAGPRVIESTVRVTLPEGFQRAEFLQTKGAVDFICDRRELRNTVASSLAMLQRLPADAVM